MLTKTKTVGNLKTLQNSNPLNKPQKDEIQKLKLSLKIEVGKEEISSTPKTTKAKDTPNLNSTKDTPKERTTSRGPIGKTELTKTTSDNKKTLIRNQTTKGPLVKPQIDEKSKVEEAKKEPAKSKYKYNCLENAQANSGKEKNDKNKKDNQPAKAIIKKTEKQEKEENCKMDAQTHINNAIILNECKDNNESDLKKEIEINHSVEKVEIPVKISLNYNIITNETKTWSVLTK